ncbi:hypothetical protein OIU77_009701 [Salix suchowensis]|uniref:Secreted protein n=1 Tax=Salix suchowensis TaxID=1278906 RepID=A0ABQ9AF31_9ROSI|nr:hypothetical protein OIU77_009701 [Salix suchowensis]
MGGPLRSSMVFGPLFLGLGCKGSSGLLFSWLEKMRRSDPGWDLLSLVGRLSLCNLGRLGRLGFFGWQSCSLGLGPFGCEDRFLGPFSWLERLVVFLRWAGSSSSLAGVSLSQFGLVRMAACGS